MNQIKVLDKCRNRLEKMTAESKIAVEKKAASSKSKFAKFKATLPFTKRKNRVPNDSPSIDGLLTHNENLEQQNIALEGMQLICREERLFALKPEGLGTSRDQKYEEKDFEENLLKDREDFLKKVFSIVEKSLQVPPQLEEEKDLLKYAVLAINQEEEQDRRWDSVQDEKRPSWRPRCCRESHDTLLREMVKQRLESATLDPKDNMSSIQIALTSKAKRFKEDLLQIAKNLRSCYPGENVCQFYLNLYHQEFSNTLREITEYGLASDDCLTILQWVNNHYPSIRKDIELEEAIYCAKPQPLLPESLLNELQEQFLTSEEDNLQTWCLNFLSTDEEEGPKLKDNCYFSHLAFDVIQCVHAVLTTARDVLGSLSDAERLTIQIYKFFINYQSFLEKVIKDNKENTDAVIKAGLHCIWEFRNYMKRNPDSVFTEQIQTVCLDLLTDMRDSCHCYFTKSIHSDLKVKYAKVGSTEWLKQNERVCSNLLDGVQSHIEKFTNLDETCLKELVSQLHKEVLAKYVSKMMCKKLKLKKEKKQQQAAKALKDNSQKLHKLFTEAGSDLDELKDILPCLAELLLLKDPQCIECQLVMIAQTYPEFSKGHVNAWLYLKGDLSGSEEKKIKKTFNEFQGSISSNSPVPFQDPLYLCKNFFSKVTVK